jgi:acyl dehydratase
MTAFVNAEDLLGAVGNELGTSDWLLVDQDRIDTFAEATGDHQWIHVDVERAAAGPYGGTIAHGYLTLSLLPLLTGPLFSVTNAAMRINYGLDRVRFLQPLRSGSRIRAIATLTSAERAAQGVRGVVSVTMEIEGSAKPALVAETIVLVVEAQA